jgi:hypothetical protein
MDTDRAMDLGTKQGRSTDVSTIRCLNRLEEQFLEMVESSKGETVRLFDRQATDRLWRLPKSQELKMLGWIMTEHFTGIRTRQDERADKPIGFDSGSMMGGWLRPPA